MWGEALKRAAVLVFLVQDGEAAGQEGELHLLCAGRGKASAASQRVCDAAWLQTAIAT